MRGVLDIFLNGQVGVGSLEKKRQGRGNVEGRAAT